MSKADNIKKLVDILSEQGFGAMFSVKGIFKLAEEIYNANFRDITELRDWLKSERDEKQGFLDEENKSKHSREDFKMGLTGSIFTCQEILNKLESL